MLQAQSLLTLHPQIANFLECSNKALFSTNQRAVWMLADGIRGRHSSKGFDLWLATIKTLWSYFQIGTWHLGLPTCVFPGHCWLQNKLPSAFAVRSVIFASTTQKNKVGVGDLGCSSVGWLHAQKKPGSVLLCSISDMWHVPAILALDSCRRKDQNIKVISRYRTSSRPAQNLWDPVSKLSSKIEMGTLPVHCWWECRLVQPSWVVNSISGIQLNHKQSLSRLHILRLRENYRIEFGDPLVQLKFNHLTVSLPIKDGVLLRQEIGGRKSSRERILG